MLAFRYGIATQAECVPAFFEGYSKSSNTDVSSERVTCKFNIHGQKVLTVMQNQMLITAIPLSRIYDTADAKAVAVGFDFALTIDPDLFTMQEIVDWRDQYLHANGGITKDDLRREIKKRAPNQRDPMEMLGLHDTFFEEVIELRSYARDKMEGSEWEDLATLDFGDKNAVKKKSAKYIHFKSLAKTDRTTLWEETSEYADERRKEWSDWLKSDEYKREMQESHEYEQRQLYCEALNDGEIANNQWAYFLQSQAFADLNDIAQASKKKQFKKYMEDNNSLWLKVQQKTKDLEQEWSDFQQSEEYLSLSSDERHADEIEYQKILEDLNPFALVITSSNEKSPIERTVKAEPVYKVPGGGERLTSYNNKPVYYHEDCVVTSVWMNPRHDGWHEIHYENEYERFITTTKHAFIADTYKAGQRGVWTISYKNVNYIQPFGGSPEEAGDFYHSPEYLEKRYQAIKRSGGKCDACGSKEVLNVDHIKPRSLYPKLELELSNLQVLCHKCNSGKGNTDTTDFSGK